ncbi:MAG: YIP1 family protein [Defluviitaleaceae bacterium]|nr:YIP1 family protein [Defluviitaleaceae bacterium]
MKKLKEQIALPLYIMRHPFDGFYRMKHMNEGKMSTAFILFFLFWISFVFMQQYGSITVSTSHPQMHNSIRDGASIFAILVLWSLSNWAVTSLTDGEGKFKEIFMGNCYAFTPLILTLLPMTLASHLMTDTESAFFFIVITAAVIYFIFLAYVAMVSVQNYGAGKALGTIFLTIFAMLIIVFLGTVLMVLLQQMYNFAVNIYTELAFR